MAKPKKTAASNPTVPAPGAPDMEGATANSDAKSPAAFLKDGPVQAEITNVANTRSDDGDPPEENPSPRRQGTWLRRLAWLWREFEKWFIRAHLVWLVLPFILYVLAGSNAFAWYLPLAWAMLALAALELAAGVILIARCIVLSGRPGGTDRIRSIHQKPSDHDRQDLTLVLRVQFCLRAAFALFVIGGTLGAFSRPATEPLPLTIHRTILMLAGVYLISSLYCFIRSEQRNNKGLAEPGGSRRIGILWPAAYWDWIVITCVVTVPESHEHYHLGYIIPLLGAWLFSQSGRGLTLFILILLGVSLKYIIVGAFEVWWPDFRRALNVPPLAEIGRTSLAPKLIFWSAVSFLVFLLRKQRALEISRRQIMDTVTRHIPYTVFQKDIQRRFSFANEPLLKHLGRELDDIIGLTDADLGIDRPEYVESDRRALEQGHFEGIEPHYDRKVPAPVNTVKRALYDKYGKVVGLVGVCAPGKMVHDAQIYGRILSALPYFAVLKDRKGHIVWANPCFARDDIGETPEAITNWKGTGRGATDIDLYGEEAGRRYRRGDQEVIDAAELALLNSKDLSTAVRSSVELHVNRISKARRWVRVSKAPWVSLPDSGKREVLGVHVYFHDIHDDHCLNSMLRRWVSGHLPFILSALVKGHDGGADGQPLFPISRELRFLILVYDIIDGISAAVSGSGLQLNPHPQPFQLRDLNWMQSVLQQIYPGVQLDFVIPTNRTVRDDIKLFESIILLLVMNACQATLASQNSYHRIANDLARPRVTVELTASPDRMQIIVTDAVSPFSKKDAQQINAEQRLARDDRPGSGLFFVRYLADRHFKNHFKRAEVWLEAKPDELGARAIFECSMPHAEVARIV